MGESLFAQISDGFYVAGFICMIVALVAVVYLLRRRSSSSSQLSDERLQQDHTNMMILLQTMRDLLEKQRDVARQLNVSLDKKVGFIKATVDAAHKDLNDLKHELENVARRIDGLDPLDPPRPPLKLYDPEAPAEAHEGNGSGGVDTKDEAEPDLRVLALPKDPPQDEALDQWTGLDFSGDDPDPFAFDVPDELPEEPEDAESARGAFKALLDYHEQVEEDPVEVTEIIEPNAEDAPQPSGDNGHADVTPIQTRVCEYHDAGMSVAQIAKELGIGKGEIRLILSLRKERTT